ncbi:DNA polymerase III subunit chi [Deferrisoma palaeochoriense]
MRIDFFEVKGPRWDLALCDTVERAYEAGLRVYVWAESQADARHLDDLLWEFREDSFVPHALWQGEERVEEPVAVGWKPGNPNAATCLVLARDASPADLQGFDQVVDFAPVDLPDRVGPARARFKAFRAAGFDVRFHKG